VFFKLLERLSKTRFHYIDLNDESELIFLEAKCRVDNELLLQIIEECVRIKFFDMEMFEKYNFLWSDEFLASIQDAYKQRRNKPLLKEDIIKLNRVSKHGNLFNKSDNPQRIGKDIKGKERSEDPSLPSLEIVIKYFLDNGYQKAIAIKAYETYAPAWVDTKGNPIKNWKMKMQKVWFTEDHKITLTADTSRPAHVLPAKSRRNG
jgi:hypothetical protein